MTVTYQDYTALYPDRLTEIEFNGLLPSGIAYLDVITHNRCENATGWKLERAKQALFAVINEMAALQSVSNAKGARLSSVSNDGYSETYGGGSADGSTIHKAAVEWLSGTGLVGAL